jgi:hypothetical protein
VSTPIKHEDIKKGDLIRKEYTGDLATRATEYLAVRDAHGYTSADGAYFLLERPKPPVVLPTEPGAYRGTGSNGEPGSLYVLDQWGVWHDFTLGHATAPKWAPTNYAPLTKLEPVADNTEIRKHLTEIRRCINPGFVRNDTTTTDIMRGRKILSKVIESLS